jgi:predicted ATP-dependent endonuclease of OLD family
MKIKKITIKNFRSFKNTTILEFEENYTTLVGKNGVGKTSILEAINLVTSFSFVESKIKPDDFNSDTEPIEIEVELDNYFFLKIADWIKLPSKKIKFVAKYRDKSSPGKAFSTIFKTTHIVIPECYQKYDELKPSLASTKYVPLKVQLNTETSSYEYWVKNNNKFKEIQGRLLEIYGQDSLKNFPRIFYFSKERDKDLKPGYFTTFQKILDELNWRFFKDYKTSERNDYVKKWEDIYSFIINKVEDPKQSKIINPLKDKIKDFLGEKFKSFEISLFNLRQPFDDAFFSLRENDKIITLLRMASGELMVIAYFLLKLTSELSKEEIIFLIDDPELHLHSQLQYKLFNEIKSSKFQHVLATHSDIFIDLGNWKTIKRLTADGIYPNGELLRKKYGSSVNLGKELRRHLDDIKTLCQDKTIFRREDNEILFCEKCLLVEGPNDKYGLLGLANKLDFNFSKLTTRYCVGKDNIHFYQTICLAYGIDFFVVYDQDEKGKDKLIEELALNNKFFSFSSTFEELISGRKEVRLYEILKIIEDLDVNDLNKKIKDCLGNINKFLGN